MEQSRKEKEVWEACEVLEAQDEKLTYKAIGDKLVEMGCCRGSNSDICRYLATWRQHKGYAENHDPRAHLHASGPTTPLFPPSQNDLWPVLEQIQQHLRQLDEKVERISKQRSEQHASKSKQTDSSQQDWLKETLTPSSAVTKSDFEQFTNSQAKAFLRLFEHHEMLFEKYLSSLDALRQTNARLTHRLAQYQANTPGEHRYEHESDLATEESF